MLVTRLIGDCPGCGGRACYGNVDIYGDHVLRGCRRCSYQARIYLPALHKKLLYLDQFFFSGAFRGGDERFVDAAARVRHLAHCQLLVSPFSSVHVDETHQWKRHKELFEFIKDSSRGHEFEPAYEIESEQVLKGFEAWLAGKDCAYDLDRRDALRRDVDKWESYFRIDVGHYLGDIELQRGLKSEVISDLVDIFPDWRQSTNTFDEDVALELRSTGKGYLDAYLRYIRRLGQGDYNAVIDSPIISTFVQEMLHYLPKDIPFDNQLQKCAEYFASLHFAALPCIEIQSKAFAALKDMIKRGAYVNRDKAISRLSGFIYDLKHVASYAPYCHAFVMDNAMAELMAHPALALEKRYGVRIFSLNNWDDFLTWLDRLEASMSEEHKVAIAVAYP